MALVRQAKQLLDKECGERLDDDQFLRALARIIIDGAHSPERTKAPYQNAVTICSTCKRGRQDGCGLTVDKPSSRLHSAFELILARRFSSSRARGGQPLHPILGTAELMLEQWTKIALGCCPKPRA